MERNLYVTFLERLPIFDFHLFFCRKISFSFSNDHKFGASFLSEMMMGGNFMQRREIFQVMNGMCVTIK